MLRYQAMHGLVLSGVFDEATREMMSKARCGFPDIDPASGVAFSTTCVWNRDSLTYAFGAGPVTSEGTTSARPYAAPRTWSANVQIAFREVGTADSPDILLAWTQALCGDANMTGTVLAHADYPQAAVLWERAARPLHFDDQEHTWCIGPWPASTT